MFTLKNDQLTVQVLDPVADQGRFGTRYCTGGYIFQIEDATQGPLLSGPTYPDSFNWFDGQGIPDAFNLGPLRGPGNEALILGIGQCDLGDNTVATFCTWDVKSSGNTLRMSTRQSYQDWRVELIRSVTLTGRTVRSHTTLVNTGRAPVPLRWFPHPFYPQPVTAELCKFNIDVRFVSNEGYVMAESGYVSRKQGPWTQGYYLPLTHEATAKLALTQRHPKLGMVSASCSYVPDFFPIWGNPNTFSWEPFLERTVAATQSLEWWIDYDF